MVAWDAIEPLRSMTEARIFRWGAAEAHEAARRMVEGVTRALLSPSPGGSPAARSPPFCEAL
jgi:hypothetical protein